MIKQGIRQLYCNKRLIYLNQFNLSTLNLIKERDNHFRSLLLEKDKDVITPHEFANIARVLAKDNVDISDDEMKKFDDVALGLVKNLDNQQLRQVISLYVFKNKTNKFVFYELRERQQKVGFKDNSPQLEKENFFQSLYLKAFQFRNRVMESISSITGLKLK